MGRVGAVSIDRWLEEFLPGYPSINACYGLRVWGGDFFHDDRGYLFETRMAKKSGVGVCGPDLLIRDER